jgi:hypothetical protein
VALREAAIIFTDAKFSQAIIARWRSKRFNRFSWYCNTLDKNLVRCETPELCYIKEGGKSRSWGPEKR